MIIPTTKQVLKETDRIVAKIRSLEIYKTYVGSPLTRRYISIESIVSTWFLFKDIASYNKRIEGTTS